MECMVEVYNTSHREIGSFDNMKAELGFSRLASATVQRSATMNSEERIQAASSFLLQAPPGEINDVLNGL